MKNTITIVLAVLLSILFVITAMATVMSCALAAMVRPENIVSFVKNVDYAEMIVEDEDVSEVLEQYNVKEEAIEDIMKSDAVEEILDVYAEGVSDLIKGEDIPEGLTPDDLKDIVDDNLDEIVDIVNDHMNEKVDEDKLRDRIITAIDENAEEIIDYIPSVEQIGEEIDPDGLEVMQMVFNPIATIILAITAAILAVLIFVCRIHNAKGFFWIGVDSIFAVVILGILISVTDGAIKPLIIDSMSGGSAIVDAGFDVVLTNFGIGIGILTLISIFAFIAYYMLRSKVIPDNHSYVQVGMYNK